MALQIVSSEERGLIENKVFKGRTLFSNGVSGTSRPDAFGAVYVFNDDVLYPESYLGMHPHANVEIVTIMVSGTESHKDTLGIHENYTAGDVQLISSGSGLYHEGGNVSKSEQARHLQIWIAPNQKGLQPTVSVKKAEPSQNELLLLVSPSGEAGALKINQEVWIFEGHLKSTEKLKYSVQQQGNGVMMYVTKGELKVNSKAIAEDNTVFIWDEEGVEIVATSADATFILIDTVR